jgi:hypothetical protein
MGEGIPDHSQLDSTYAISVNGIRDRFGAALRDALGTGAFAEAS